MDFKPSLKLHNEVSDTEYQTYVDPDDHVEFVALRDGTLRVVVSEEQAMDSYNQRIDCSVALTRKQATKMRDWLNDFLSQTPDRED